jgi:hypothetical protein
MSPSEVGGQLKAESGGDVFLKLPGEPVIELLGQRGLAGQGKGRRSVRSIDMELVVSKVPRRSRKSWLSKTGVSGKAF